MTGGVSSRGRSCHVGDSVIDHSPLGGQRVLVTRPVPQAIPLRDALERVGATVTVLPTIQIGPPTDSSRLVEAVRRLAAYDWVVVSSVNGVRGLAETLEAEGCWEAFFETRVAAVGAVTADAVRALGCAECLVPEVFRGEALADAILEATPQEEHAGMRVLIAQAEVARRVLFERLSQAGAVVDVAPAYATMINWSVQDTLLELMEIGAPDWLTFTAASTVNAFVELVGPQTGGASVAAISPVTASAVVEVGLPVHAVAAEHTARGLVQALVRVVTGVMNHASFPVARLRRLRRTATLRGLMRETRLEVSDLVYPMFVDDCGTPRNPIASMPGIDRVNVQEALVEAESAFDEGIRAVLLFGIPRSKDANGSQADHPDGVIQRTTAELKSALPDLAVITDVCLCEYTDHGHCGILDGVDVANDATLERLAKQAVSHAVAGADIVAPSDMMDGRIGAIRTALDDAGFQMTVILSYAAKYASAFYGPFRDAADSTPAFGDRRSYQMDPRNSDEALREVALDLEEGADMVMVKPALPSLDVLKRVKDYFGVPTAAYQVSGEYAMIEAAGANGWLDAEAAHLEAVYAIRRAGADIVVTYAARKLARALADR